MFTTYTVTKTCIKHFYHTRTNLVRCSIKVRMDMLSLCRKRTVASPSVPRASRRSERIADFQNKWTSKGSKNVQGTSANSLSSRSAASTSSYLPAISEGKDGNIVLRVLAKAGAKQSAVTDIRDDYVGIQIAALARDGQANYELVEFLASMLGLRKNNISIEKGLRSRIKSVLIVKSGFTTDQVKELLQDIGDSELKAKTNA